MKAIKGINEMTATLIEETAKKLERANRLRCENATRYDVPVRMMTVDGKEVPVIG